MKILIIDDDKEFCEELSEILKGESFDVDCCFSPEQGIVRLRAGSYGILILDFKMPGMNGIEFLKKYKDDLLGLRIFVISGTLAIKKMLDDENLTGQISAVLSKPFDIHVLIQNLKEVIVR